MGKVKITIEDLFNLPTAVIYNPDNYRPARSILIDSRKNLKGSLFIAIKGEKYDGHDFVSAAVKKGAGAVLIDKKWYSRFRSLDITLITVEDTVKALGQIAAIWRDKLNALVISITGSTGKTTTKEIAAALLNEKYKVVKTEANNNNHIGVPLTILSADENCEMLILEQGTNHLGEIPYSAKISRPDISLITNIGDSHIEFLKNKKMIFKEKSALFDESDKRGGIILANTDDPIIASNINKYSNVITYGFNKNPDLKGNLIGYTDDGRTKIRIDKIPGTITLPVYGQSNAKNFLAAAAIAKQAGLSGKLIKKGAEKLTPVHGRLDVKKFQKAVLIDDTYNSSPASVAAAYDLVKQIRTFKLKIVVMGDIFELGKQSEKIHRELSKVFSYDKNLFVLTIGKSMASLTDQLRKRNIKSIHFHLREALSLYLKYEEIDNSVILVKGSRGMKMEEFVNILEKRFE